MSTEITTSAKALAQMQSEYVQHRLIHMMHKKVAIKLLQSEAEFCRRVLAAKATRMAETADGLHDLALGQECLRLAERMRAHSLKPAPGKGRNITLNLTEASTLFWVLENTTFTQDMPYELMLASKLMSKLDILF